MHPALHSPAGPDKGKGRAAYFPEQLASPGVSNGVGHPSTPVVSGNIGSAVPGASRTANRQNIGGLQVESRYAFLEAAHVPLLTVDARYSGVDTLDEPVTTTIVCRHFNTPTLLTALVGSRPSLYLYKARSSLVSEKVIRKRSFEVIQLYV